MPAWLIADLPGHSALAKAGQSVLLIDQEDTYGSEHASFTLEALRQSAMGRSPSLTAEAEAPMPSARSSLMAQRAVAGAAARGLLVAPLPAFRLPLHGIEGFTTAAARRIASRGYILDLMPKVRAPCMHAQSYKAAPVSGSLS